MHVGNQQDISETINELLNYTWNAILNYVGGS
jgi:hypothetical protein